VPTTSSKAIFNSEFPGNTRLDGPTNTKQAVRRLTGERDGQVHRHSQVEVMGQRGRDTGGQDEGGASNHTEGTNQDQGRRPQGDRGHKDFKIRVKTRQEVRVVTG